MRPAQRIWHAVQQLIIVRPLYAGYAFDAIHFIACSACRHAWLELNSQTHVCAHLASTAHQCMIPGLAKLNSRIVQLRFYTKQALWLEGVQGCYGFGTCMTRSDVCRFRAHGVHSKHSTLLTTPCLVGFLHALHLPLPRMHKRRA